jgi:hypothetical protein
MGRYRVRIVFMGAMGAQPTTTATGGIMAGKLEQPRRLVCLCLSFLLSAWSYACTGEIAATSGESASPADPRRPAKTSTDPAAPAGASESTPGSTTSPAQAGRFEALPGTLARLTVEQYHNTIADIFGPDIKAGVPLEEDEATELFLSIGAAKVGTSALGVEQYQAAALSIADQVMQRRATQSWLAGCAPERADDPCITKALESIGLRLWRRPLKPEEVRRYVTIVGADGPGKDKIETGLRFALATLLQSPHFLHMIPTGEPDSATGLGRYTGFALASRLAYLLWNSTPDVELLEAARAGKLATKAGVETEVRRMLGAPRARSVASRFFAELWQVSRLEPDDKDTKTYPAWSADLLQKYRREFAMVVEDLVFLRKGDIRELLDGKNTFADATLAKAYGISGGSSSFTKLPLPAARFGLLTSGAVMSANAKPDRTSPTLRGVFVLERLLCEEVPPPPPNANDVLPADQSLPVRERLAQHRSDPACAGCHALFDPLGLAFERFDGIGLFRTSDGGQPIDASGEIGGRKLNGAADVAALLRSDPRASQCLARQFYSFAAGHQLAPDEGAIVEALGNALVAANHRFEDLIVETASSNGFRYFAPRTP